MERRWKIAIIAMGIVGLMASASFATNEGIGEQVRERLFFGRGITPMEMMAEKAGITLDQWFELKELGMTNQEIIEKYNLDLEEIREEALQEKYKVIDQKVAEGLITVEEAEVLKERMGTRVLNCENRGRGMGFGKRGGRGRGFGNGGGLQ